MRGRAGADGRGPRGAHVLAIATAVTVLLSSTVAAPEDSAANADATAPLKIMLVGDSLTHGHAGDHTWRWYLDRHLRASGTPFDFVGPRDTIWSPEGPLGADGYADPAFDRDHAAWWGDSFHNPRAEGAHELVATHRPDAVVLALGTNDLNWYQLAPERVLGLAQAWIEEARNADPELDVVLMAATGRNTRVEAYNEALPGVAEASSGEAARTAVAPWPDEYRQSTGMTDEGADTWDGIHPNAQGQARIATSVARALAQWGVGNSPEGVLSPQPEGPPAIPALKFMPTPDATVRLVWEVHRWSTAADVWKMQPDGEWQLQESAVEGPQWESAALEPCAEHTFMVRLRRGWTLADPAYAAQGIHSWSAPVTQTPRVSVQREGEGTRLTWPQVDGACRYEIEVRDATGALLHRVRSEETSWWSQGPAVSQRWRVSVRGVGADALGPATEVHVDGPVVRPAVRPPARVQLRSVHRAGRTAVVRWHAADRGTRYEIRTATRSGRWGKPAAINSHATRVRLTGLSPRLGYRVQVRALGRDGQVGAWSRPSAVARHG